MHCFQATNGAHLILTFDLESQRDDSTRICAFLIDLYASANNWRRRHYACCSSVSPSVRPLSIARPL